jgi:hypothetical protein
MAKGKKRKMAGWEGFVKALLQVAIHLHWLELGVGVPIGIGIGFFRSYKFRLRSYAGGELGGP